MNFEFEFIKDNVRISKKARNAVSCRQYAEVIEKGGRLTWEAVYDSLNRCFGLGTLQSLGRDGNDE